MALTGQNERLKVNHGRIDADHLRLVEMLNRLEDAVTSRRDPETCGRVLNELIADTRAHFAREEALMTVQRYPSVEQHVREHGKLMQELFEFKARFDAAAVTLAIARLKSFERRLTRHIRATDKALAADLPSD